MNTTLKVAVDRQGLYDVTHKVNEILRDAAPSEGLVTLFLRHTSASLVIQENADPRTRQPVEGPDDMPAHIKGALTATSLSIPLTHGKLALGTWQGIYLWEHRHNPGPREIVVNVIGS